MSDAQLHPDAQPHPDQFGPNGELDDRPDGVQVDEVYDGETSLTEDPEREPTAGEMRAYYAGAINAMRKRDAAGKSPLDQVFEARSFGRLRQASAPSLRDVQAMTQPPLDFQPELITKQQKDIDYESEGQALVGEAATAMTHMRDCLVQTIARREISKRDPMLIGLEAQAVLRVADFCEPAMTAATRMADAAVKTLEARATQMRAEMRKEMTGENTVHGPLAQEIRQHCKSLPSKHRSTFIEELIAQQDRRALAALFLAPAYLTGIDPRLMEGYVAAYNHRHHAATLRRIGYIEEAVARLTTAGASLVLHTEEAMATRWATVRRLRDARSSASY